MKIIDALNLYVNRLENVEMLSKVTIKNRRSNLEYMANYFEANNTTSLRQLTLVDVREYFTSYSSKTSRSRNTIATMQNHIRLFFRYLQESEGLELGFNANKIKAVGFVTVRKQTIPRSVLYNVLRDVQDVQVRIMVILLFTTGLRASELVKIKLDDIDGNYIQVIGKGRNGGKLRYVNVPGAVVDEIFAYARAYGRTTGYLFTRNIDCRSLGQRDSSPDAHINTDTARRWLRPYFAKYGYEFTPHIARYTFAQDLLKNGADLRTIQDCLGHSSLTTTTKYLQVPASYVKEVYDRCMTIEISKY